MSRFGDSGTFFYRPGDAFSGTLGGTYLYLQSDDMPQYPFETINDTDRVELVSKTGKRWAYENYNLAGYKFVWANASQALRDQFKRMYDSNAVMTFNTNGTLWGTFRQSGAEWQDSEVGYDLFDFDLTIIENV